MKLNTGDLLMVAKQGITSWTEKYKEMDFIANGEIAVVRRVRRTRELYGFRFAEIIFGCFPIKMTLSWKLICCLIRFIRMHLLYPKQKTTGFFILYLKTMWTSPSSGSE